MRAFAARVWGAVARAGARLRAEVGLHELLVVLGLGLLFRGLWMVLPAAAWIAVGVVLLYLGTWHGFLQAPRDQRRR